MLSSRSLSASKVLGRIVLFAWILIISWLSLDPAPPVPESGILGWDKILHAAAYGCLTFLGGWSLSGTIPLNASRWICIGCAAIGIGALMEVLQYTLTTTRTADFLDLAANAFGVGIALFIVFIKRISGRNTSQ